MVSFSTLRRALWQNKPSNASRIFSSVWNLIQRIIFALFTFILVRNSQNFKSRDTFWTHFVYSQTHGLEETLKLGCFICEEVRGSSNWRVGLPQKKKAFLAGKKLKMLGSDLPSGGFFTDQNLSRASGTSDHKNCNESSKTRKGFTVPRCRHHPQTCYTYHGYLVLFQQLLSKFWPVSRARKLQRAKNLSRETKRKLSPVYKTYSQTRVHAHW